MGRKWKILAALMAAAVTLAAGGCAGKSTSAVTETTAGAQSEAGAQPAAGAPSEAGAQSAEAAQPKEGAEETLAETEAEFREKAESTDKADAPEEERTGAARREDDTAGGPDAGLNAVKEEDRKGNIEAFAELIQEAVADRDMEALAGLIVFPVTLHTTDGEALTFRDREEFLKQNPDLIFGDDLMMAVANVDTAVLEMKDGAVMLGGENVFIRYEAAEDKTLGIVEIRE